MPVNKSKLILTFKFYSLIIIIFIKLKSLFVLSVKYDSDEQKCTLILRTKDGNLLKEVLINTKQVIGEINIENMFNIADLMQVFEKVPRDIKPVTYPMVYKLKYIKIKRIYNVFNHTYIYIYHIKGFGRNLSLR